MENSVKQRAYREIRQQLLSGKWSPGQRIAELSIARDMGISRAPVREAMRQLAGESLVELVPGMGAYVKKLDPRELRQLYDLREAIETHAAGRAARRVTARAVASLEACNRKQWRIIRRFKRSGKSVFARADALAMMACETRFHGSILRWAGNPRLVGIVGDLDLMGQVWSLRLDPKVHDMLAEHVQAYVCHRRITAALRRHDVKSARRWMRHHVRTTMLRFLKQAQQQGQASE